MREKHRRLFSLVEYIYPARTALKLNSTKTYYYVGLRSIHFVETPFSAMHYFYSWLVFSLARRSRRESLKSAQLTVSYTDDVCVFNPKQYHSEHQIDKNGWLCGKQPNAGDKIIHVTRKRRHFA